MKISRGLMLIAAGFLSGYHYIDYPIFSRFLIFIALAYLVIGSLVSDD